MAVRTFARKLGREPEELVAEDVAELLPQIRRMLNTLLGSHATSGLMRRLEKELAE